MALDTTSSLGALTGTRYIQSLRDGREVWLDGDPNRNRINLLRGYDQSDMMDRIKALESKPLLHE
ncbi:MAG: hypothetical protein NZ659_10880 [Acidimicrobiales bacterium]|nr:hypothetical protein [Acidimicrobiales bacterium]